MSSSKPEVTETQTIQGSTRHEKKKKKKRKRKRGDDAFEERSRSTIDNLAGRPRGPCDEAGAVQEVLENARTERKKRKEDRLADSPRSETSWSFAATSFHQKRYDQFMEEMARFAGRMSTEEDDGLSSSQSDEEDDEMATLHKVWPVKKLKEMRARGKEE